MLLAIVANAKTIAISYFDNTSGDVKYNALSKGIADMLITDLSKVKGISIVEREKLEKLIQEIKLEQSKYFDPATAQKLGKGLGAQNILTGSFYLLDNTIRIDARLIDVQTGGIVLAEQVTGTKNNFFSLHQQLATLLSKNLNVAYSPDLSNLYTANQPVNITAVVNYSNALELQDQGMTSDAQVLLDKTIKTYPNFKFAKNKLDELKEWLKQIDQQREALIAEELKNTIATLDAGNDKFGTQLTTIWTTLLSSYKYNQILAFNNTLKSKKFDPQKKLFGESSPLTLAEMMLYYDCLSYNTLKKYDDFIESAKTFISTYPTSIYFQSVKTQLEQAIKELEQREKGKNGLQTKLDAESLDAYINYLNKLRWKSNLQFVSQSEYKNYKNLYTSQILSATKEVVDTWDESIKFNELAEFFDVAAHFNDVATMENIVSTYKKMFANTDDEERALSLETKLDDFKTKQEENKPKIKELENIAQKGNKEELEKIIHWLFSNEKYNRPDILLAICERYITNYKPSDKSECEKQIDAWKGYIIYTATVKNIEEAKKHSETFKEKSGQFQESPEAYKKALKEINTDIKRLENDYNSYQKNLKNYNPMTGVLENHAALYKDNYQYTQEAYTRKQLLDLFKLDNDKESLQLFLLAMSYYNLGYFDNTRKVAEKLNKKYPSGTYNESLTSIINFMPH